MTTKYEKRLTDKGWILYLPSVKGVTVFMKITSHGKSGMPLMNIGLLKDNYWSNYVLFAGDEDYLEKKVNAFLIDYEMKKDWDKHIKNKE